MALLRVLGDDFEDDEVFLMDDIYSDISAEVTPPETPRPKTDRSYSLGSAMKKTSSGGDKKVVHFADSLGLDLVEVRPFINEVEDGFILGTTPPLCIKSFHSYISPVSNQPLRKNAICSPNQIPLTKLYPLFEIPGEGYIWQRNENINNQILERIYRDKACLQSVNTIGTNITGVVAVLNLAYNKKVWMRYTIDAWKNYTEVLTMFINGSIADQIDKFSFSIYLPASMPIGAQCEFCIRYECGGNTYWDNNNRRNYTFECRKYEMKTDYD